MAAAYLSRVSTMSASSSRRSKVSGIVDLGRYQSPDLRLVPRVAATPCSARVARWSAERSSPLRDAMAEPVGIPADSHEPSRVFEAGLDGGCVGASQHLARL